MAYGRIRLPEASGQGRGSAEVAELSRRVSELEDRVATVRVTSGSPAAGGREGSLAGDAGSTRLWLKLNGVWRYVTLT